MDTARLGQALQDAAGKPWALQEDRADAVSALIADIALGREFNPDRFARAIAGPNDLGGPRVNGTVRTGSGKAVVPIHGLLLYDLHFPPFVTSARWLAATMRELADDSTVTRIVLDIASPGGVVTGIEEAASEIFKARQRKAVVAAVNPFAGSAAYWLASQASEITVTPSGDVGSIGVFVLHLDLSGAMEQAGVRATFIKAGKFKTEGNAFEPLDQDAEANIQRDIDAIYNRFIGDVARGRGVSALTVRFSFGEGRMKLARDALRLGMVDRLATIEEVIAGKTSSRAVGGTPARERATLVREPPTSPSSHAHRRRRRLALALLR